MYCSKCGKIIEGDIKFCPICGTPIERSEEKVENVAPTPVVEAPKVEEPPVAEVPAVETPAPAEVAQTPVAEQPAPAEVAQTPVAEASTPVVEQPAVLPTPEPVNNQNSYNPVPNNYYATPASEAPKKGNNTLFVIIIAVLCTLIVVLVICLVVPNKKSNSKSSNNSGSTPVENGGDNGGGTVTPVVNNEISYNGITFTMPEGSTYEIDDEGYLYINIGSDVEMWLELNNVGLYEYVEQNKDNITAGLESNGYTINGVKHTTIADLNAIVISASVGNISYYIYVIADEDYVYNIEAFTNVSMSSLKLDKYIGDIIDKATIKSRSDIKIESDYKSVTYNRKK